jgi:putative membrane protein
VPFGRNPLLIVLTIAFFALWISTFVGTTDRANWLLENALVFIALGAMVVFYKRMQFSDLSYLLIFLFLCLHIYGAKHTYAENPFGYWLKDALDLERNHYDRIVHFSFGFFLAYPIRESFLIGLKFPPWVS